MVGGGSGEQCREVEVALRKERQEEHRAGSSGPWHRCLSSSHSVPGTVLAKKKKEKGRQGPYPRGEAWIENKCIFKLICNVRWDVRKSHWKPQSWGRGGTDGTGGSCGYRR